MSDSDERVSPVRQVRYYETPDGERHETYKAAMKHYKRVGIFDELDAWASGVTAPFTHKALADSLRQRWKELFPILAKLLRFEGDKDVVDPSLYPVLSIPLTHLSSTLRFQNGCRDLDIRFVGEAVQLTKEQWLNAKGVGQVVLTEVESLLGGLGLRVGMAVTDWKAPRLVQDSSEDESAWYAGNADGKQHPVARKKPAEKEAEGPSPEDDPAIENHPF